MLVCSSSPQHAALYCQRHTHKPGASLDGLDISRLMLPAQISLSEFATKAKAMLADWNALMNSRDMGGRVKAGMDLFKQGRALFNAVSNRCCLCSSHAACMSAVCTALGDPLFLCVCRVRI